MTVPNKTASFGFREVPEEQKEELVGEVFTSVANRYDLMNDLMSGGVHRLWKDTFVDWLNPQPGMRVLDVAGGTGDIAVRIAKRAKARGGEAEIVICDINASMLNEGLKRSDVHVGVEPDEHAVGRDVDVLRVLAGFKIAERRLHALVKHVRQRDDLHRAEG